MARASQTARRSRSVGRSNTGPPRGAAGASLATGADPAQQLDEAARLGVRPGGDPGEDRAAQALPGAHDSPLHRTLRPAQPDLASLVELDPDVRGRLRGRV